MSLANRYRPKKFSEVVGQESELEVLTTILTKGWHPSVIAIGGPYGTGKTTFARLIARAIHCEDRQGIEPCGNCDSCLAVDNDNHPAYKEIDAASHGQVADVRQMKDHASYHAFGKTRIIAYDEAHVLSSQAQDAMLKMFEEGIEGVLFILATTDMEALAPTIRSRCVELKLRLLTAAQIKSRLEKVCQLEGFKYEERALRVLGSYVRGHMRDALILLEQLAKLSGEVTEEGVRTYLRLDKMVEVYELLGERDRKASYVKLEALLCNYAPQELTSLMGQVLIDTYKLRLGCLPEVTQVDQAWLERLSQYYPENEPLVLAEKLLTTNTDFSSVNYAIAVIGSKLFREDGPAEVNRPKPAATNQESTTVFMRKPKPNAETK